MNRLTKDNFMILATALLAIWFIVVWIVFLKKGFELDTFTAYATFGTALATLLLAFATVLLARESKASREENRKLVETPRI